MSSMGNKMNIALLKGSLAGGHMASGLPPEMGALGTGAQGGIPVCLLPKALEQTQRTGKSAHLRFGARQRAWSLPGGPCGHS